MNNNNKINNIEASKKIINTYLFTVYFKIILFDKFYLKNSCNM